MVFNPVMQIRRFVKAKTKTKTKTLGLKTNVKISIFLRPRLRPRLFSQDLGRLYFKAKTKT